MDGDTLQVIGTTSSENPNLGKELIASCGEGSVYIIRQVDANRYEAIGKMKTVGGASTSRYVPELGLLYLAVPIIAGRSAEIRVYSLTTL